MSPDAAVIRSIEMQGVQSPPSPSYTVHNCGCSVPVDPSKRWYLCQYHEGFSDGLEAAARP